MYYTLTTYLKHPPPLLLLMTWLTFLHGAMQIKSLNSKKTKFMIFANKAVRKCLVRPLVNIGDTKLVLKHPTELLCLPLLGEMSWNKKNNV